MSPHAICREINIQREQSLAIFGSVRDELSYELKDCGKKMNEKVFGM